jgi:Cu+-exporting ATPase
MVQVEVMDVRRNGKSLDETEAAFGRKDGDVDAGAELKQVDFAITGMTCAACVARVERALASEAGVASASVNLAAETARVKYDAVQTSPDRLFRAIEAAGYGAREAVRDADEDARRTEERRARESHDWRLFYIGAAFSIPLVLGMIADIFQIEALMFLRDPLAGFVLATPVVFVPGSRFYVNAARTVAHGGANMDVLVALGTGAAYVLSVVHTFIVPGPCNLALCIVGRPPNGSAWLANSDRDLFNLVA